MGPITELACFEFLFLLVDYILKLFCVVLHVSMHVRFFSCIGYHEVMHGAVLSITGLTFLTRPNLVS